MRRTQEDWKCRVCGKPVGPTDCIFIWYYCDECFMDYERNGDADKGDMYEAPEMEPFEGVEANWTVEEA